MDLRSRPPHKLNYFAFLLVKNVHLSVKCIEIRVRVFVIIFLIAVVNHVLTRMAKAKGDARH